MKEELLKGLTDEQIAKIKACKNTQEVLELAKEEGIELNDEQLEAVSGGCGTASTKSIKCPVCRSKDHTHEDVYHEGIKFISFHCRQCGCHWEFTEKDYLY